MAAVEALSAGEVTLLEHETQDASSALVSSLPWSRWLKHFRAHFVVRFVMLTDSEAELDLVGGGVEAPLVNAVRRLLLSDVPSMAIEKVMISNNTSVLQDEVLAQRLGLVPLRADPLMFEYRGQDESATPANTLQFQLRFRAERPSDDVKTEPSRTPAFAAAGVANVRVLSNSLRLLPLAGQEEVFTDANAGPVHDDILLALLRPGQEISLQAEAVKSCGRDHAKFSPVATAWYRLLPSIRLVRRVFGRQARQLRECFSPGVIKLVPVSGAVETDGDAVEAVVEDARYDNCSRNVFRYDDLRQCVQLGRVKDHFIFTVESVGAQPPDKLFVEAAKILSTKCRRFLAALDRGVVSKAT